MILEKEYLKALDIVNKYKWQFAELFGLEKYDYEQVIVFPDPPAKYIKTAKKKTEIVTDKRTGKTKIRLKETTYYLNGNLFYSNDVHFSTRSEIVNFAKDYLLAWCDEMPKLELLEVELIYYRTDNNFDLDNKAYFWQKVFLDLLKTPSKRELKKAQDYRRKINTLEIIPDDNVRYVKKLSSEYRKGQHKMEIILRGRRKNIQNSLF